MVDTPDNHHHTSTAAAAAATPAEPGGEAAHQEVPEPSFKQLLRVGITKGLPFVAFGFFDNIIMVSRVCLAGWLAAVACSWVATVCLGAAAATLVAVTTWLFRDQKQQYGRDALQQSSPRAESCEVAGHSLGTAALVCARVCTPCACRWC